MKNLLIILSTLTFAAMVNSNVQAQYIAGDSDVCSDEVQSYLAEPPAGVTFRKWLGVNPYLVNGTSEYDLEIDIDWSLVSASSFYLAWTGRFGGGGTLTVTNTHLETPTFIVRYYNECCTDILFETDIIDDATNYYWEITGFNDDPDDETTSGNTWQTNVNDPGGAGTVKVKGYFGGGCNKYGGQKTIVYN